MLGIGAMWTPLWLSPNVGLGASVDASVKYDSLTASNGSASATRFPVAVTLHFLTNGSGGDHYFMLKGGLVKDFGVTYSLDGADASLNGSWGGTGAIGYYGRTNDSFAWDLLGFFALSTHTLGETKFDATGFGLSLGCHLNL